MIGHVIKQKKKRAKGVPYWGQREKTTTLQNKSFANALLPSKLFLTKFSSQLTSLAAVGTTVQRLLRANG